MPLSHAMIDLHGASTAVAEREVNFWLSVSASQAIGSIRFVTGRGNHPGKSGVKGILYQSFVGWIERSPYKERIKRCEQHDGYFEVRLKPIREPVAVSAAEFTESLAEQWVCSHLEISKKFADEGNVDAQMIYAHSLEMGKGIKQDFKAAARYYRLAAERGHAPGMHELARCYLHGLGVKQSDKKAVDWLQKAAALNDPESIVALGDCYWYGHGAPQDPKVAVGWYAKAAAFKSVLAMRKLANAYAQGAGVQQNKETSFVWYKKAADLGDSISQYNVGTCYRNGTGTLKNHEASLHYFRLAAKGGDPDAQYLLGALYADGGESIPQDKSEAIFWLELAAENGSSQANRLLLRIGDESHQQVYLSRAAAAGDPFAKAKLAAGEQVDQASVERALRQSMYDSFHLTPREITLLAQDARLLLIDTMLMEGKPKILQKALGVLVDMAEQNCIYSLRRLFRLYISGSKKPYIKKDVAKAMTYLEKGAALGDPKALCILGAYVQQGEVLPLSLEKAVTCYEAAMQKHYPPAFVSMGLLLTQRGATLQQISSYMELAILYEQDETLIRDFDTGLLDVYDEISTWAKKILTGLTQASAISASENEGFSYAASSSSASTFWQPKSEEAVLDQLATSSSQIHLVQVESELVVIPTVNTSEREGSHTSESAASSSRLAEMPNNTS